VIDSSPSSQASLDCLASTLGEIVLEMIGLWDIDDYARATNPVITGVMTLATIAGIHTTEALECYGAQESA